MTNWQLIELFYMMLRELWAYVANASVKGKVDCSGAFVYALKQYGLTIAHGSNTIWRQAVVGGGQIGHIDLVPGMAVFKRRTDGGEPEKYRDDGIGNIYHMGLYVGPTEKYPEGAVIHAKGTEYGVVMDSITAGWTHAGRLKQIQYIDAPEEDTPGTAIVVAETGSTVNLRKQPDSDVVIFRVPIGSTATVLSRSGEWTNIRCVAPDGKTYTGWMMTRFLNFHEEASVPSGVEYDKAMALYKQAGDLQKAIGELFGIQG